MQQIFGKINLKILLTAALLPIVLITIRHLNNISLTARAAPTINLFFDPSDGKIPPDKSISLWLDTGFSELGFIRVECVFDPLKLKLTDEVKAPRIISTNFSATSKNEANQTGRIIIIHELRTDKPSLTGVLEIAKFTLTSSTEESNQTTKISIADIKVQIVDLTVNEVAPISAPAIFSINPVVIPSPTATFTKIPVLPPPPTAPSQEPLPTATFTPPPPAQIITLPTTTAGVTSQPKYPLFIPIINNKK